MYNYKFPMNNNHVSRYFKLIPELTKKIDTKKVEKIVNHLAYVKKNEEEFFFLALVEVLEIVHMQLMTFVKLQV